MGLGIWGMSVYSVLVKRRPTELDGLALMLVVAALGTLMILPFYVAESLLVRAPHVSLGSLAGILYIAVFPSIGSYFCWNAGVAALGANRAGFTIDLLPAFHGAGRAVPRRGGLTLPHRRHRHDHRRCRARHPSAPTLRTRS